MPLWRFIPIADEHDSHWQDRRIWDGVIVRASNAAMARVLADAAEERRVLGAVGNETRSYRGGFSDTNLYWVERLSREEADRHGGGKGPEGVVAKGTPRTPKLSIIAGANAGGDPAGTPAPEASGSGGGTPRAA
jgi:hypothetical protein